MRPRPSAVPVGMFVAALSAFVVMLSSDAPSMAGRPATQIPDAIQSRIRPNGWVRVLVELKLPSRAVPEASLRNLTAVLAQRQIIGARRARLLAKLPPGTYRVLREYLTIPYVAIDVTTSSLAILANRVSDIEGVLPDALARPDLADSAPLVQADQAWSVGYDGSGVAVGIVDTGVDATHPFLAGRVAAEACYSSTVVGLSESVCPNRLDEQHGKGAAAPCPFDECFHGTHVAGVAAGDGRGAGQSFSGVARGATVLAVQAFSRVTDSDVCPGGGRCVAAFSSDILAALEHLYILSWEHRIAAINLSLGSNLLSAACDDEPYKAIVDNLRAVGVATVVASGNAGATSAIASPACVSSAVSVGSTTKSDRLSAFSNVAPSLSLLAPGESITSSLPDGAYGALSGTSMAAAHVTGAFAVVRQALPTADVTALLDAFRRTGLPIADTRSSGGTTVPRLRLFEALASLVHVPNPVPSITSLTPYGARAGAPAFSLTIDGSGFDAFSVARWNGLPRPTTVVSTGRLIASIAAADIASVGMALVSVSTPAPGGGTSSALSFTIDPPATLTPSATRVAPGADVTVTLANGFGGATDWLAFAATSAPDNTYLQQTPVGAGVTSRTWTVTMPTTPGTYEFRLFVNDVRKATSAAVTVDRALTPPPIASSLSPDSVVAGGSAFTLTVHGSQFVPWSVVRWNGANRITTFVSSTELQAAIDAADIASVGTAQVSVLTPVPGGGTSGTLTFAIANPVPSVLSLSPSSATAGAPAFTLTVNGSGFVSTSVVRWNGSARTTTFVSGTQLRASILASDVAAGGTAQVSVLTAGPGGGTSGTLTFTIAAPSLMVNATTVVGGTAVTVTLANGPGGAQDWMAFADVSAPNTSYVSWTYVGAGVSTRTWMVTTPTTGGPYEFRLFLNDGYTRAATSPGITIVPPAPVITSLNPSAAMAGTSSLSLIVNGSNFTPTSVVQWNGSPRPTTYFGSTLLSARISSADLASVAHPQVTVSTPPPGGGTSNAVTFIVTPPPALTVNTTSVARGGLVTVTLTGGVGGATDWIAFAATSASNTSYLQWTYVGAGVTTRTWTITAPPTAGTYEFRLFLSDGFTRAATSPPVTVQ